MTRNFTYSDALEMDLQSYQNDCDRVDTAIVGLESICRTQDILTDKDSTLDATSLSLAQQSVECFLKMGRIGVAPSRIIPSNESFGNQYDISQATLESIGEGIKNVFMSIINAIKKAFEWMWGLIKRLFGRGKDHEEKIEHLKSEAEAVKSEVKDMKPEEQKAGPYPRNSDGWFAKIELDKPQMLKKIVTSKGLMTEQTLSNFMGELAHVFELQPKCVNAATQLMNGVMPDQLHFDIPFHPAQNNELVKKVSQNQYQKVYASQEFGGGEFVYVLEPVKAVSGNNMSVSDQTRSKNKWVDEMQIGKTAISRPPDYEKFKILDGDHANGDKLIAMIESFNKFLRTKTDALKTFQGAKERFLRDFEAKIKKEGVNLFSSSEKKQERDAMMLCLKFFKKTMDQPAVLYYGECDAIITTFEHLTMYVLAYNRRNGNQVALKDAETKAVDPREKELAERRQKIAAAKGKPRTA